jgi:glycolate oxidase iron-sulfur subunit
MQTNLADFVKKRVEHDELESILRACVHCGFCNATCPTYQLLGDELDGPRGRIYLMKQVLEGKPASHLTQLHLDRCLSCRSCETTCPSGVKYGRLLDLGRIIVEEKVGRSLTDNIQRYLMRQIFPYRKRFQSVIFFARLFRPVLPESVKNKIPRSSNKQAQTEWPQNRHRRKMLILTGCVQAVLAPSIDTATAQVLDKLGISLLKIKNSACCGALNYHLSDHKKAGNMAKQNIDACWPYIEQGAEAVVMTASGCGVTVKEYGKKLQNDPEYREKARRFSALVKDISEVLKDEDLSRFKADHRNVAFQSPCTLQHGQKLAGCVESILQRVGYHLTSVRDGHLCCGSAGVYSLLEPHISQQLKENKLQSLQAGQPDVIATANIGCLSHLQAGTSDRVVHWIELLHGNESRNDKCNA